MMDNSHSINREGPEDARTTSRKLTYFKCHNIITCTWGKGNICWKKQWNTNTISFHAFCEEPWGKERNVCIFHAATVLCSPTCWHFDLFIHQLLIFACWLYTKKTSEVFYDALTCGMRMVQVVAFELFPPKIFRNRNRVAFRADVSVFD